MPNQDCSLRRWTGACGGKYRLEVNPENKRIAARGFECNRLISPTRVNRRDDGLSGYSDGVPFASRVSKPNEHCEN